MFILRYLIARRLIYLGIMVMPGSRYKRELLEQLHYLKLRVEKEVTVHSKKCGLCCEGKPCNSANCPDDVPTEGER